MIARDPGFAPAKVNLCLHVTGRRADGYHLLDSLVVFADTGDRVALAPAGGPPLTLRGPEAGALTAGADNLVLRAAHLVAGPEAPPLTLTKRLPVASGIGGGSSDAAAALRLVAAASGRAMPDAAAILSLGADVPVCLEARPARMSGIGEAVLPLSGLPPLWAVLVNPRRPLATAAVFGARRGDFGPALPPLPARWRDGADLVAWLAGTRNDLEAPARALMPEVGALIAALGALPGARLARMSGSGASAFAIMPSRATARAGARLLARQHPEWWVRACRFGGSG
jgi:4-diphosphocytidyl-2-C-methyl-D-erythritol kinase